MCGIVGYISKSEYMHQDKRRFMYQGLYLDAWRGMDSTGVIAARHKPRLTKPEGWGGKEFMTSYWFRSTSPGPEFVETDENFEQFCKDIGDYKFVAGHNRAATRGSVSVGNAHPFTEGPITLVHNGTIGLRSHGLPIDLHSVPKNRKVQVDSHLLTYNMAKADSWRDVLPEVNGSYALVWHDGRDDRLYMARNSQRPLHLAIGDSTIWYMSEASMLWFILSRVRIHYKKIVEVPRNKVLIWDGKDMKPEIQDIPVSTKRYHVPKGGGRSPGTTGGTTQTRTNVTEFGDALFSRAVHASKPFSINWKRQILSGGVTQDVPEAHQLAMLELDRVVEEDCKFTPGRMFTKKGQAGRVIISGTLDGYTNAVVYDFDAAAAAKYMKQDWTVWVYGVKWFLGEDGKQVPMALCKVMLPHWREPRRETTPTGKDTDIVRGPHGANVTRTRWIQLTEGGCILCENQILLTEVDDIMWTSKGQPICSDCFKQAWSDPDNAHNRHVIASVSPDKAEEEE